MNSKKTIALILVGLGVVAIVVFLIVSLVNSKKPTAGLKVDASPMAQVFVDNVQIGQTPIEKMFKPGEVTVKIIPTSTDGQLSTYQTKVKLVNGVYTVIKRDFGKSDLESSGDIVSLQPQSGDSASLAVVTSSPDSAAVSVDGQSEGFTPLLMSSLSAGEHQIVITAPGYSPRTISALAMAGYKLTVNAKLALLSSTEITPTPTPSATISATPSISPAVTMSLTPTSKSTPTSTPKTSPIPSMTPKPTIAALPKPYVEILSTPTGFLRVRSNPSLGGTEIGQVKPGESYPLLSSQSGWYQIKVDLSATSSGWISSQYAKKFE